VRATFRSEREGIGGSFCSRCASLLRTDDMNVAADTALCRKCGATFRFSDIVDNGARPDFDPARPPKGATFEMRPDGFEADATTRSYQAWFLIPFTLIWSGFTLHGIYGTQYTKGQFSLPNSLLGIPFLIVTAICGTQAVMSVIGKVRITGRGDEGIIFQGLGFIGRTVQFRWADVESVRQELGASQRGWSVTRLIRVTFKPGGRSSFKFGTLLTDDRRSFLLSVLRWRMGQR